MKTICSFNSGLISLELLISHKNLQMQKIIKFTTFWFIQKLFSKNFSIKTREEKERDAQLAQEISEKTGKFSDRIWVPLLGNIMVFFNSDSKIIFIFKIKEGFFNETTQRFNSEYFVDESFRCIKEIFGSLIECYLVG